MKKSAHVAAATFGFLGVALGAFGAHSLHDILAANDRLGTWDTAVLYQLVHVALLLVLGILNQHPSRRLGAAIWLAVVGIIIFSGSLYLLSLTNLTWLGAITPIGGVCFLAAWILFLIDTLRSNP